MEGSEEKKRVQPTETAPAEEEVLRTDAELYGDESDIPLRAKKKKPAAAKKKSSKKRKKKKKKGLLAALMSGRINADRALRKRHSLFDYFDTDNERSVFKPLNIFGIHLRFWPVFLLGILVAMGFLVFLNNSNIAAVNQTVTVVGLPADLENYRILVISDLNGRRFGDEQSALLRVINNNSYNAVICLGDMVGKGGDPEPFYELLDGLPDSKPVYFIAGDADPDALLSKARDITGTLSQMVLADWVLGAEERGATYVDSPVQLTVGSSTMWLTPASLMNYEASEYAELWKDQMEQEEEGVISGLDADYATLPVTTYRQRVADKFDSAISSMSDDDFYIVLAHQSPSKSMLTSWTSHSTADGKYIDLPELLLAGHYCGGVWRVPWLGAFYIPDSSLERNGWFPSQDIVKGLSTYGETQIYTSGGLSTNAVTPIMSFRLFNQPEINIITLSATLPENMLDAE